MLQSVEISVHARMQGVHTASSACRALCRGGCSAAPPCTSCKRWQRSSASRALRHSSPSALPLPALPACACRAHSTRALSSLTTCPSTPHSA